MICFKVAEVRNKQVVLKAKLSELTLIVCTCVGSWKVLDRVLDRVLNLFIMDESALERYFEDSIANVSKSETCGSFRVRRTDQEDQVLVFAALQSHDLWFLGMS